MKLLISIFLISILFNSLKSDPQPIEIYTPLDIIYIDFNGHITSENGLDTLINPNKINEFVSDITAMHCNLVHQY